MKTTKKNISVQKENGRFYTPTYMVENILDMSGYYGNQILKKHAIDNSCGDGAFLSEMVRRYCEESKNAGIASDEIKKHLEIYIHGIEIETTEQKKCIDKLNGVVSDFGIDKVEWDIICGDALSIDKYNGKMDYVLGNPPYVRVHNLGDSFDDIKAFSFAQDGMTDLYIVFYEIGIKMLSKNGTLGYITPSSFFNSIAGSYMRKVFVNDNLIDKICNLRHYQAFNATTYTTIVIIKKNKTSENVDCYLFDEKNKIPFYIDTLSPNDYYIAGNFYFEKKKKLAVISKIYSNLGKCDIAVKNGYATLCDEVFINDFTFDSKYIIPVVKASRGIVKKAFFPYARNGSLIPEEEIKCDNRMYSYLLENKEKLLNRSNEKSNDKYWYAFGRSQAIKDTYKDKLSINSLLRTIDDFKFVEAPKGTGVYGGLYLVSDTIPIEQIKKVLKTEEFFNYVSLLGKYKSGGYYTFSSKDVKAYLDYKFAYDGGIFVC